MATLFADGIRNCGFTKCASKADMGIDAYYQDGANVTLSWQNISEAENTMAVKAGIGVLFVARLIAFFFKIGWYGLVLSIIL
jgi:hypothetical protein